MQHQIEDRRIYERFSLHLQANLYVSQGPDKQVWSLQTEDISAGGAALISQDILPENSPVYVEITLPAPLADHKSSAPRAMVSSFAHVVRTTAKGMAVKFDKKCSLIPQGIPESRQH